ncbi:DUF3857 domain-containing protein [Vibrio intestinalis]|uniref:DUF3857 domain-containing protein n=1 Tax=Vibrio intestinalis TaxID=2933291 RepID=UPI0021A892B8|nr:DUF3857 domain-containing protein [Vibrio intestinalis]
MKTLIIATTVLLAFSPLSFANNVTWQQDLAAPQALINHANRLKAELADDAGLTRLSYQQQFEINPDSVVRTTTVIDYYPSFIDIDDYGSKSVYFDQHQQQVEIVAAMTLDPDGNIATVDPKLTKRLDTHSENTFTDEQQLLIPLPSLTEGSLSIVTYKTTTERPKDNRHWSHQSYTQRSFPIQEYLLSAQWSDEEVMQWRAQTKDVVCNDLAQGFHCQGKSIAAYKHDNATRWQDHIGRIEISDFTNWQQVVDKASQAMNHAQTNTEGLDKAYQKLTDDAMHIEDKIGHLLHFVARDIRYVSMSEAEHAQTPHTIEETLRNRYGDCKDKSTLLKALLAKAGIESDLVLVDTDRFNHSSMLLPAMGHFNHVVVCFDLSSQRYCLDPTDNLTDWKTTPTWIQGKANLVLKENHQPQQIASNDYRWRFNSDIRLAFNAQGGQKEHQTRSYFGEYSAYYRQELASLNNQERQDHLLYEYQDEVSGLAEPNFTLAHVDDMNRSLTIESHTEYDPFLEPDAKLLEYTEYDSWLMHELDSMHLRNEWHSEYFSGIKVTSQYEFDLSNSPWKLDYLPSTFDFKHRYGSMNRQIDKTDTGKLKVITQLKIPAQMITSQELEHFNRFLTLLHKHAEIKFTGIRQ